MSSAILKLQKKVISWPEDEEPKSISARISKAYGSVNYVGLIDGTLFPLAFAPMLNQEDYFTRKGNYAVKGLIFCNDTAKITWVEMGWPSSVHNNRVWSNSHVYLSKEKYFNNREYLLGDLAFSASSVLVTAFKNSNMREDQSYFTTKLSKVWIKSKHCLGLLKAWFQCFQGPRWVIPSKWDLDVILQMTMCACILHNLLINHVIPQDWMDNSMELEEDKELDHHGEMGNRWDQLLAYLMEIL